MRAPSAGLVAAALIAAGLAGCGVPPESAPHSVDPPRGPFQAITSPTPGPAESGSVEQRLFMVKDGRLVAVTRHSARAPTVQSLVGQLLRGPIDSERNDGVTSALQGATTVSGVHLDGGLATIELASPLAETGRNDAVLAYAQLVCTLTARPEIQGVTFTSDDQPIGVPRADGSLTTSPLTTRDYAELIASK